MLEHPKHAGPEGVKEIFWILAFLSEIDTSYNWILKNILFNAIFVWLEAALGLQSVLFMKGVDFSSKNAHLWPVL